MSNWRDGFIERGRMRIRGHAVLFVVLVVIYATMRMDGAVKMSGLLLAAAFGDLILIAAEQLHVRRLVRERDELRAVGPGKGTP